MKDPYNVLMLPKFGRMSMMANERHGNGTLLAERSPIGFNDILLVQQFKQNPNLRGENYLGFCY